jgi:hypothetical protein
MHVNAVWPAYVSYLGCEEAGRRGRSKASKQPGLCYKTEYYVFFCAGGWLLGSAMHPRTKERKQYRENHQKMLVRRRNEEKRAAALLQSDLFFFLNDQACIIIIITAAIPRPCFLFFRHSSLPCFCRRSSSPAAGGRPNREVTAASAF